MALFGLVLGVAVGGLPRSAAARVVSQEHQIIVRGVVPELRMIVVGAQERIQLITSNTPNDVPPTVVLMAINGPKVPLSDEVRRQYETVMEQVHGNEIVTVVPAPGPLADLLPDFASGVTPARFQVIPTPNAQDPMPEPYWVSAQ